MRVICDIKPRRDGTVIVEVGGRTACFLQTSRSIGLRHRVAGGR